MNRRSWVTAVVAIGAIVGLLVPTAGVSASSATYAGAATVVAKQSGQGPLLDDGAAVCLTQPMPPMPNGLGGACLPFPTEGHQASILVQDQSLGTQVAFQVCIDNNGDGHCYMPQVRQGQVPNPCDDIMGFSHGEPSPLNPDGFANPLGFYIEPGTGALKPLPTSIPAQCQQGETGARKIWRGYIVFLCEGAHVNDAAGPHVHTPTTGLVAEGMQPPDVGAGNFCQAIRDDFKEYFVLP